MLKGYHIVTLTHRTSSLEEIGCMIPDAGELSARLHAVKDFFEWEELYFLSTCNRIMIGFYSRESSNHDYLRTHLALLLQPGLTASQASSAGKNFQIFNDGDAVRHVFEVASSMDSLVVGEREIIRQLRESYERCRDWGLTGDHFRLLMTQAVEVSKQVFNATGIGEKALSVVALGYGEMRKNGIKPNSHIVLVGAGATNQLLCKFLVKDGFKKVSIFNRTISKAEELAQMFSEGNAYSLEQLPFFSETFDAIVVCTGSVVPVLNAAVYGHLKGVDSKKVVVDFSVPNNVDSAVVQQFPVHFIEIEGLREVAKEHLAYRETARQKAEHLISGRIESFRHIWHERQVERSLAPMIDDIKSVKNKILNDIFSDRIDALDDRAKALMAEVLGYMEKKCVAIPVKTVKQIAQQQAARFEKPKSVSL